MSGDFDLRRNADVDQTGSCKSETRCGPRRAVGAGSAAEDALAGDGGKKASGIRRVDNQLSDRPIRQSIRDLRKGQPAIRAAVNSPASQ